MKLQKPVKKSAKADKATKAPKATKMPKGPFLAVGPKGTCFTLGQMPEGTLLEKPVVLTWGSFKAAGIKSKTLCDTHAKGKAMGGSFAGFDLGCHVGYRGESITLYPLSKAIKGRIVKSVKFTATQGKVKKSITGFVPANWDKSKKLPQYIATADLPAGRVETKAISDGRAQALNWEVTTK